MPYASFKYWMSFVSLALGFAIGLVASLVGYRPLPTRSILCATARARYRQAMSSWDDDDWTGTPPEGRHEASRANPGFWAQNRAPMSITGIGVGVALIILLIVLLL